jgi:hypothetical protein
MPFSSYHHHNISISPLTPNRKELSTTQISGPSTAASPIPTDTKWVAWLKYVAETKTIPDIYAWHQIGSWSREPDTTLTDFNAMKAVHSLPDKPIDINEYADKPEQNPANSVYYIAQLERHNMRGLRANWGSKGDLHDFLANLVFKEGGTYVPNGEWQLYKYYATMGGDRIATSASPDRLFDVFATKTGNSVKVIAGTRTVHAPYTIEVKGLGSLGLPSQGSVKANVLRFDWAGDFGRVDAPVELASAEFTYADNTVSSWSGVRCRFDGTNCSAALYIGGSADEFYGVCVRVYVLGRIKG